MLRRKEYWLERLDNMGMAEVPLKEIQLNCNPYEVFKDIDLSSFMHIQREFLKFCVSKALSKLVKANFSRTDVKRMRDGIFPENVSIFFKTPIEYGGSPSFDNMFLMKTNPFANIISDFYMEQISIFQTDEGTNEVPRQFYTIDPEGYVFIPISSPGLNGGKKKNDKSQQLVADQIQVMKHAEKSWSI
ncbi:MAG: hypothetical protein N4A44_02270 [Alphaproteobacteria bacterium]|jgi:hypothetical protein|nr:hypothetical protein [Alphaproteobacteria bacterium]